MRDVGTLLEALPYIRQFHGKTVVIKIGGAAMTDAGLTDDFAKDIVLLRYVGLHPIVVHGGDPNWGRVAQAVGAVLHDAAPLPLDIHIEDVQVCAGGAAIPHDPPVLGDEVDYTVVLPGEGAAAEVFFSDLSHEYVTINADYTT